MVKRHLCLSVLIALMVALSSCGNDIPPDEAKQATAQTLERIIEAIVERGCAENRRVIG